MGRHKKITIYECDWYCDNCDSHLNSQSGFDFDCGTWTCTECGHENEISEDEIIEEGFYESNTEDPYYEDEDDEGGCSSWCGNPAYPNCKTSCKMWDD